MSETFEHDFTISSTIVAPMLIIGIYFFIFSLLIIDCNNCDLISSIEFIPYKDIYIGLFALMFSSLSSFVFDFLFYNHH